MSTVMRACTWIIYGLVWLCMLLGIAAVIVMIAAVCYMVLVTPTW